MRWQIEVKLLPTARDSLGTKIQSEVLWFGFPGVKVRTARLFLLQGDLDAGAAETLARDLLTDPVMETHEVHAWESYEGRRPGSVTVFKKPGVMDPAEANILRGAAALGHPLERAHTAIRYDLDGIPSERLAEIGRRCLANEAIEDIHVGEDRFPADREPATFTFERREIPLLAADDEGLLAISREGCLSLDLAEMRAIQAHFRDLGREPTDVELETLAQTWSEHCKHKTFTSRIRYQGPPAGDLHDGMIIPNLLKDTIKEATRRLDRDFCLSVFHDNAGVISFDGSMGLCFKVETHNHPSAIEPYGGAGTGVGGVIRDILGTGLGARPVANVDVFCVGPLDLPQEKLPRGTLHPLRVLRGVVAGVRDYGNQMGIPTTTGAVFFDERYVGNPLVFCGTLGLIPTNRVEKRVRPGDLIVTMGGRTGRDGIHGATFSSVELHEESETLDSGAVQIGNAITEKKVMDVLLQARDRELFSAVTDCGAGGFSSAVGEMGEETGARVHLERAPLKYAGLSYTEIWISEAQERMVFAVPPEKVDELLELAAGEDVEAVVLGEFTGSGRLELFYEGHRVADLDMGFLHDGVPATTREAVFEPPPAEAAEPPAGGSTEETILALLRHPDIASKEWIIRQYDHEVQCASAVKPLVGTRGQGPSDGAVLAPILGRSVGFAVGLGMNPRYGDLDPYGMALLAVDEAVRNVVALGGDPSHCAILDNFSWGNCSRPDRLGGLVRAAFGCRDAALALGTPFISGKDSLNNEFRVGETTIVIPPSLLISAVARVPDVRRAVTMDLKESGSRLYLAGVTCGELGGSHYLLLHGLRGRRLPAFDGERARRLFKTLHDAMGEGLVRACHDLAEGGLGVALAEMVLAGEVGAEVDLSLLPPETRDLTTEQVLFSESPTRFLLEVRESDTLRFEEIFAGLPLACLGRTLPEARLRIARTSSERIVDLPSTVLEEAFRRPLSERLDSLCLERNDG